MASEGYLTSLFGLHGQTALCTGATRGIGRAIAIAFASAGADIILAQRDVNKTDVADEIRAKGVQCRIAECDLSNPASVKSLIARVTEEEGSRIDILLNCGGIQRRQPVVSFSDQDWDEVIQVNLTALWTLSRDCGRHMLATESSRKGKAKIINIASLMSYQAGIQIPAYTTSKHGILGITKACTTEWATSICCNSIAPGYATTELTDALTSDPVRSRQIMERIPAQRWATPEDFVGAAIFLASRASDYTCGETILVDGGWMAR